MNVLLTNDDGIDAAGLLALRRALAAVPGVRVLVIAPDGEFFKYLHNPARH